MLDIKWIRENPEQFDAEMHKRSVKECSATILKLDEEKRSLLTEIQKLQSERNAIAQQLAKNQGSDPAEMKMLGEQSRQLKSRIDLLEQQLSQNSLDDIMKQLPNVLDAEVPFGTDDDQNIEVEKWGEIPQFNFTPKEHFDLAEAAGLINFEQAAKVSGARFTYFEDKLVKLERALANFMLDVGEEFGYREIGVPLLVNNDSFYSSGHLPKFGFDAYQTTDFMWLIPTGEVSLLNWARDRVFKEEELPCRVTTYSACFRREAGSAGKDFKGFLRQHQFYKVELFSFTTPEQSEAEHQRMTNIAKEVLKRLKLPFHTILKCSGDTGISAAKTYDLEVWVPGQNKYREISSCSNCQSWQARRANIKYVAQDGKRDFVHTLNGSSLALGRAVLAVLENYQQADGSIVIPEALRPYLKFEVIEGPKTKC